MNLGVQLSLRHSIVTPVWDRIIPLNCFLWDYTIFGFIKDDRNTAGWI